ncbi:MAG: tetratricopeptide repeat protein [Rhizomicrobium sp.]|jgi:TPR repeat protein
MRKTVALIALSLAALLGGCAGDRELSSATIKTTFDEGLKDYDSGNYEAAYKKWLTIDKVDLAAMRNVGIMLRTGKGVQKDPKAAEAMLKQAAEAGLFTAQADLGDMLLKGEAGPPDPKAAAPWLAMAAEAGHPMAQYELGELCEQGVAVPKNIEAARTLYKAAAAGGVADAAKRLAALPPEPAPAHSY